MLLSLKIEAAGSSETLTVIYQSILHLISEDAVIFTMFIEAVLCVSLQLE
jgi:hypothetical protein